MSLSDDLVGQRQRRIANLEALKKLGIDPYPSVSHKEYANAEVVAKYDELEGKEVTLAGRLGSKREHGVLLFADLLDQSGKLQLWVKKDTLKGNLTEGYLSWEEFGLIDVGDFIEASGKVTKTASGQISLEVGKLRLISKSLRPIPWKLTDKEQLFRRRYLDLSINQSLKELFVRKAKFWRAQREFLESRGFMEVETPVLEHVTGGADARPFATYHNDLNEDFYLRISTELFQKRLIGAGFEKIYTFGPNFRNEGVSEEHLQEYYQVEWYWAYANYRDNMLLVRDLFRHIAKSVYGKTKFTARGHEFDLADEWQELDYAEVIKKEFNIDIFKSTDQEMLAVLKARKVKLSGGINRNRLVDNLWKLIRKTVAGPAFLVNEPKFMSPLAKSKPDDERLTERFHVVIAGSELGNGYTEINDPQDQLNSFLEQQKLRASGDEEAQMMDLDFVEMLEYGMPPVSGYGQSERIFWTLENVSAREGTLFPQMAFEIDEATRKVYGNEILKYTKKSASTKDA